MNKEHVKQPMIFNAEELQSRISKATEQYLEGQYAEGSWRYPAAVIESTPTLQMLLERTIELTKQGQALYPHADPAEGFPGYWRACFWKPQAEIDSDIVALKESLESDYRAEIERFNSAQVEILAQQLYEAEQRKAAEAERKKEEKAQAKALEEAKAYFASISKEG
jgi:hypothetical protein